MSTPKVEKEFDNYFSFFMNVSECMAFRLKNASQITLKLFTERNLSFNFICEKRKRNCSGA